VGVDGFSGQLYPQLSSATGRFVLGATDAGLKFAQASATGRLVISATGTLVAWQIGNRFVIREEQ